MKQMVTMDFLQPIDHAIMDPIEEIFDSVGLMQGDSAPLKRAAVGALLGYAIAYGLKPSFAFNDDDSAKPFAGTASDADQANSTWFPAYAIVALPAIVFSVFI